MKSCGEIPNNKESLQKKPILQCSDYTKEFCLQMDASNRGMQAMLNQEGEDGLEHPVLFKGSNFLEKFAKKECLAAVNALKHFAMYLMGRSFQIHSGLRYLDTMKNSNSRLTRWFDIAAIQL